MVLQILLISPNYHFFPKYDAGRFEEGNSTMILSAGLGGHTIPFRVFDLLPFLPHSPFSAAAFLFLYQLK